MPVSARAVPRPVSWTPPAARFLSVSKPRKRDAYDEEARKLSQKGLDEEEQEVRVKQNQVKRPWLREDADKPPVEQRTPQNANTKGKHVLHTLYHVSAISR